jgi:predicted ATP-grasp superfamily ATP-dependent carboligase
MNRKNILVFPCGSEVALEVFRSIENSIHFNLIGGSSTDDHGKFIFENYIGDIPFITDKDFVKSIKKIVEENNIDAIYPATDLVLNELKKNEKELGCKIVSSSFETTSICLSKSETYKKLKGIVHVPIVYSNVNIIEKYPVFLKPDIGYGSRGVLKAENENEVINHLNKNPNSIILEYLPGKEFTVDCFTNFSGELLFVGQRERKRITNGISVNTSSIPLDEKVKNIAHNINQTIKFNGAWFFQIKENSNGELVLLEIASRLAGSSSVYRMKGVNFALLSLFNEFNQKVNIIENNFNVELDRALENKFRINMNFNHVYVDLDDTLIIDNKVNYKLIGYLYKYINEKKKIHLITKHKYDLKETLSKYKLNTLFESVIHLKSDDRKSNYIKHSDSILIDDSFAERKEVYDNLQIPVFGVDFYQ